MSRSATGPHSGRKLQIWRHSIDYARLGRLYLKQGEWEGRQIVPAAWVKRTTAPVPDL